MGPLAVLHIALVGFFACASLHAAWTWWLSRADHDRLLLIIALQCALCAGLSASFVGITSARTPVEAVASMAARLLFGLPAMAVTALLIERLSGLRARLYTRGLLLLAVLTTALALAIGLPAQPAFTIRLVSMPWGEVIALPQWQVLPRAIAFGYFLVFSVDIFGLAGAARLARTDRLGGTLLGLAAGTGLVTAAGGLLTDRGTLGVPYLGNLPFAFWVVLSAVQLSREHARVRHDQERDAQRLRAVFDHTLHYMGLLDTEGVVLQANRPVLEAAGVPADAVLGKLFWQTPLWAHSEELREQVRRAVLAAAGGGTVRFETWHPLPDGTVGYVDFSIKPVCGANGQVALLIPEGRDITARKKTQKALDRLVDATTPRTGQDFFQTMVDTLCEICECDFAMAASTDSRDPGTLRTIAVSRGGGAADNFAYAKDGTPCEDVTNGTFCYYPSGVRQQFPNDAMLVDFGLDAYMAMPMTAADGRRPGVIALMHRGPLRQPQQAKALLQVVAARAAAELDRRRADAALIESESRFRELIRGLDVGVVLQDEHDHILVSNPAASRMLGLTDDQLRGRSARAPEWGLVREDGTPLPLDEVPSVVARRTCASVSNAIVGARTLQGGQRAWLQVTATPQLRDDGAVRHVLVTLVDITDIKRAEDAVRASSRRLSLAISATSDAVWEWNYQTGETYYSPRWLEMLGASPDTPLTVATLTALCHPDDLASALVAVDEATAAGRAWALEVRVRHADGRWVWVLVRGSVVEWDAAGHPLIVAGAGTDVTLRKEDEARRHQLDTQLAQSQRMESMGRLAGGIAHDFNNLLTIINGYSDLLLNTTPLDEVAVDMVSDIRNAGDRAAGLTRQLLTFSRHQVVSPHVIELNEVVGDTERMLQRLIGEQITLVTVLHAEPLWVNADPGQLGQVVVNLAVNARDAMPEGGTLTLATTSVRIDAATAEAMSPHAREGEYVVLSVTDTGTGIPSELKALVFEPFFTTKGLGKGTGLGLTTVHGIVRQGGGFLTVNSEAGHGSTFTVYLPTAREPAMAAEAPSEGNASMPAGRTVLMVEDEAPVRAVVHQLLRRMGFNVLVAAHAEEALQVAAASSGTIDLLLTDVIMPGLNGRQLAQALVAQRPGLRVLYMSGYTDDPLVQHLVKTAEAVYLQKPFDGDTLLRKLHEALDAAPPSSAAQEHA